MEYPWGIMGYHGVSWSIMGYGGMGVLGYGATQSS